jgi:hypothetical protein
MTIYEDFMENIEDSLVCNVCVDTFSCGTFHKKDDITINDYKPTGDSDLYHRFILRVEQDEQEDGYTIDLFQYNGKTKKSSWVCVAIEKITGYSLESCGDDMVEGFVYYKSRFTSDEDSHIQIHPTSPETIFIIQDKLMMLR